MPNFAGNTTTTAIGDSYATPATIVGFSLANKTGGAVTASVAIFLGSTIYYILYNKSIATGDSYIYVGGDILIPIGYQVYVSVSGSTDFIFNIQ